MGNSCETTKQKAVASGCSAPAAQHRTTSTHKGVKGPCLGQQVVWAHNSGGHDMLRHGRQKQRRGSGGNVSNARRKKHQHRKTKRPAASNLSVTKGTVRPCSQAKGAVQRESGGEEKGGGWREGEKRKKKKRAERENKEQRKARKGKLLESNKLSIQARQPKMMEKREKHTVKMVIRAFSSGVVVN